jgi:hypothetical protein
MAAEETETVARAGTTPAISLSALEEAIRASWGRDTCDENDVEVWNPEHAATGQCAATAYVVNDLLGGRLLGAEVRFPDGTLQGHHYWNLFDHGLEVDLTLEQFREGEQVGVPDVMERIHATPDPGAQGYLLLRERVMRSLGLSFD